jgi:hypothetical protein
MFSTMSRKAILLSITLKMTSNAGSLPSVPGSVNFSTQLSWKEMYKLCRQVSLSLQKLPVRCNFHLICKSVE